MNDPEIQDKIDIIRESVDLINTLMAELHEKNVEVRIAYKDKSLGAPNGIQCIELWRAVEHVDYLTNEKEINYE